jgi:hypothetical protein
VEPPESTSAFGEILRLPAERGERLPQCVVLYSCCCCCCCCLHTLGAAIGAAGAGNFRVEPEEFDPKGVRYPSCQGIYWSTVLYAVAISALAMFAFSLTQWQSTVGGARAVIEAIEEGPILVGLTLILLGPLWLLGAAVLAAVRISFWRDLPDKEEYYLQLGRITARMVVGTLIGIGVMFAIGVLFLGIAL